MDLIPLDDLSIKTHQAEVETGLLLPHISAEEGYRVYVRIIHEYDQFRQDVEPAQFEMRQTPHPRLNEYGFFWRSKIDLGKTNGVNSAHWGTPGKYLYRFAVESPGGKIVDWVADPFARDFGMGKQSSFTIGDDSSFSWRQSSDEKTWKTPPLNDLIVYEMMVHEFIGNFNKALRALDYLADLGVNALQIMPLTNVERTIDWGYEPVYYFGVSERYGGSSQLKLFVSEAHKRGIAIIADLIWGHVAEKFPYVYLYEALEFPPGRSPFHSVFDGPQFHPGRTADYDKKFVGDFFFTVCNFWLERFHFDGIRYDSFPGFYKNKALSRGFSNLLHSVRNLAQSKRNDPEWSRFFGEAEGLRLIQCADGLDAPEQILHQTPCNCVWQDNTLKAAAKTALGAPDGLRSFAESLALEGFPATKTSEGETMASTAFQYIENHDHSRFICNFNLTPISAGYSPLHEIMYEGDRNLWYKVRPYLMALFMAKGAPMLWQGQEFLENAYLPESGLGKIRILRALRWDLFYDPPGQKTANLVRKLIRIRKKYPQLRLGDFKLLPRSHVQFSKGLMAFTRTFGENHTLVVLNFTGRPAKISLRFDKPGVYFEEMEGKQATIPGDAEIEIEAPANYGCVWCAEGRP